MQSFVTFQQVVRIITIGFYNVKEVESVSGKTESVSHSVLVLSVQSQYKLSEEQQMRGQTPPSLARRIK